MRLIQSLSTSSNAKPLNRPGNKWAERAELFLGAVIGAVTGWRGAWPKRESPIVNESVDTRDGRAVRMFLFRTKEEAAVVRDSLFRNGYGVLKVPSGEDVPLVIVEQDFQSEGRVKELRQHVLHAVGKA